MRFTWKLLKQSRCIVWLYAKTQSAQLQLTTWLLTQHVSFQKGSRSNKEARKRANLQIRQPAKKQTNTPTNNQTCQHAIKKSSNEALNQSIKQPILQTSDLSVPICFDSHSLLSQAIRFLGGQNGVHHWSARMHWIQP